jgi:hypothetical protein
MTKGPPPDDISSCFHAMFNLMLIHLEMKLLLVSIEDTQKSPLE